MEAGRGLEVWYVTGSTKTSAQPAAPLSVTRDRTQARAGAVSGMVRVDVRERQSGTEQAPQEMGTA